MKALLTGAVAAAAIVVVAGAAHAATNACVWTGHDWACGDGSVFSQHFSSAQGPNIAIVPLRTQVMPAREPRPYAPPPGAY